MSLSCDSTLTPTDSVIAISGDIRSTGGVKDSAIKLLGYSETITINYDLFNGLTESFTLSFWFNSGILVSNSTSKYIVSTNSGNENIYGFTLYLESASLVRCVLIYDEYKWESSSLSIHEYDWNFFALSFENITNTAALYYNGNYYTMTSEYDVNSTSTGGDDNLIQIGDPNALNNLEVDDVKLWLHLKKPDFFHAFFASYGKFTLTFLACGCLL